MIKERIFALLEKYRGLVVVCFCLPASFIFDSFIQLQKWIHQTLFSSPQDHQFRIKQIQDEVLKWNQGKEANRQLMCSARPNWLSLSTTFFEKANCHKIHLPLYDILELNENDMTVYVEPMVTVREITNFLIPKGFTLEVTLEIADATLGGLALGVGMTTYSHKSGLYQESICECEVVLADGSFVKATKNNEYSDLFHALPWSHGTLCFLVGLKLKIIPVKPYIHLQYIPVRGINNYCNKMRELSGALSPTQDTPDFLEATVFSKHEAVIMVGNFCDKISKHIKVNKLTRWYKPWFYKHVEGYLLTSGGEEYIPIQEYLLRHNRAIFWVMLNQTESKCVWQIATKMFDLSEAMIPFGNHPLFRFFLGWLCPPKPAFLKFTTTPGIRAMTFTKQVFQDITLPMTVLELSINKAEELFDTYPVLIYPCRMYNHGEHKGQLRPPRQDQMCPNSNYGMFYDLGVYGIPGKVRRKETYNAARAMREMESFIRNAGGYSFLYADIFMKEDEFEEMFDLTLYNKCRKKYKACGAFPNLYDKVKPEVDVFKISDQYAKYKSE